MNEHPSLTIPREKTVAEAEQIAKEFLEPFHKIAESREKLRETEEELKGMIAALSAKVETLGELKRENLVLERDVLNKIKAQL